MPCVARRATNGSEARVASAPEKIEAVFADKLGAEATQLRPEDMTEEEKRTKAWVGDAVLALFAREWILKQKDISIKERAGVFIQMTSNQFLASLGEPTAMEAEIGVVYEEGGLQAAFDFIEQKFLPLFIKQRKKRQRPGSYRKKV